MVPQDFDSVLEFADKVHALGVKLGQTEQDIVRRIKAQMPHDVMTATDPLDSFSKIRQTLMRLQTMKRAYAQPKPATTAVTADPHFMQAQASGGQQQASWGSQGAACWFIQPQQQQQQGIPLQAWLNPGTPRDVAEEAREAILNYVRAVNNNGGGMRRSQKHHAHRVARKTGKS